MAIEARWLVILEGVVHAVCKNEHRADLHVVQLNALPGNPRAVWLERVPDDGRNKERLQDEHER